MKRQRGAGAAACGQGRAWQAREWSPAQECPRPRRRQTPRGAPGVALSRVRLDDVFLKARQRHQNRRRLSDPALESFASLQGRA